MQAVQRSVTYFSYPGCSVRLDERRLKTLFTAKSTICLKTVAEVVCEYMSVDPIKFHKAPTSKSRKSRGSNTLMGLTRQLYCYLAKDLFPDAPVSLIGKIIYHNEDRKYDHTTVLYGIKSVNDKLYTEEVSEEMLSYLKSSIQIKLHEIWQLYQSEIVKTDIMV